MSPNSGRRPSAFGGESADAKDRKGILIEGKKAYLDHYPQAAHSQVNKSVACPEREKLSYPSPILHR
jgi:hypothetical protein